MRRSLYTAVSLLCLSLGAAAVAAEPARVPLRVVTLGRFPAAELDAVVVALESALPVEVIRGGRLALPKAAWYPPRKRYRADRLLDFLRRAARPGERILGVTAVDISTTKGRHRDWGVFGLAHLGGPAGVISRFRLKRKARDAAQVRFRVATTAVHEVGHTLGLDHCAEARCVMQDAAGSIANTDSSTGRLGPGCTVALTP